MNLKKKKVNIAWIKTDDGDHTTDEGTDKITTKKMLRESWHTYIGSTTLHCMCHLGNQNYSWQRRICWLLLFIGLMIGFIFEVKTLTVRYFEYQTVTKEVTLYENELAFPAVTICNLNKIDNDTVTDPDIRVLLEKTYMTNPLDMNYFESLNSSFINAVNLTQILTNRSRLESGTAVYCKLQLESFPCGKYFRTSMTNYGLCLIFNSREFIKERGKAISSHSIGSEEGLVFALMTYQEHYFIGDTAAAGFKVVVHDPMVEPAVREVGVVVSPGTSTLIGLHKTERIYLPSPVKAFGDESCTDIESNEFKNYLKYYDQYSLAACLMECETDYIIDHCGCKDAHQPGSSRTCNAYEYVTCVMQAKVNFSVHGRITCNCILPCKYLKYSLEISNAWYPRENFAEKFLRQHNITTEYLRKNLVELRVYFESKLYTQRIQVLEMTDNDVYGTLGGYMGLCFGASIGTVWELFECFFNICIKCFKRRAFTRKSAS